MHLCQCQLDLCDNLKNTKFCINMTSEGVYIFSSGIFLCNENVYTLCYMNNISKVWYLFFICPFLHILHKKSITTCIYTTSQDKWTMFYIPPWQLNEWICPWFFFIEIYNYVVILFVSNGMLTLYLVSLNFEFNLCKITSFRCTWRLQLMHWLANSFSERF
jgi:hypothetical protein